MSSILSKTFLQTPAGYEFFPDATSLVIISQIRTFSNTIHKNKLEMGYRPNVKPDTIKLLEENRGRMLFDINCSSIFLDLPPRVMKIKTKINGT